MATIEILGLDRTLEHPQAITDASFAVVRDGKERMVHVRKVRGSWCVTAYDERGEYASADEQLDGSFTDAALCGIGLALERSSRTLLTA